MICLPVLQSIRIDHYGLFPGQNGSGTLKWEFQNGLTLIAGVNGLGKTTLLMILLRIFSGPFDLTGYGVPSKFDTILPEGPVGLRPSALDFFAQRVADRAESALSSMSVLFGTRRLAITRRLDNLALVRLKVDDNEIELSSRKDDQEANYQVLLCDLFGVSSFVDVLLLLHHMLFIPEGRTSALWDPNAQKQILRAAFLDKQLALTLANSERELAKADSRQRNTNAQLSRFQSQLRDARATEDASPKVRSELEGISVALEGSLQRLKDLETNLEELDDARHKSRLELERSKIEFEQARGSIERAKYSGLLTLFPKMEDAARLYVARILSDEDCLVCGATTAARKAELESQLSKGYCPACGAKPDTQIQTNIGNKFVVAQMEKARKRANTAEAEVEAKDKELKGLSIRYEQTLDTLTRLQKDISDYTQRETHLNARLPQSSNRVSTLQNAVDALKETLRSEGAATARAKKVYEKQLDESRSAIVDAADKLASRFSHYSHLLLSERAKLVPINAMARLTQGGQPFEIPAFAPEMSAADRPGLTRRELPTDVSQSQRELIDLAFRLALIETSTRQRSCSLVMETPEASLDGIAMARVGKTLNEFSQRGENRLVVTTNFTNPDLITSLFGGPTKSKAVLKKRRERVLNLLEVAAPNRAVENDRRRYQLLLTKCLQG